MQMPGINADMLRSEIAYRQSTLLAAAEPRLPNSLLRGIRRGLGSMVIRAGEFLRGEPIAMPAPQTPTRLALR
jgi:hypothetical protein